ncbi:MAG: T9SS type A sorting domain-containing protein [Bacteroidota bacterium]|nr:T9SS type A sorting domain-containing protein [Bacteroidota bacterium]
MKRNLLLIACIALLYCSADAQGVTQINANKSLQVVVPLPNNKTLLYSQLDSSIWVTDATLAGTFQISPDIKFDINGDYGLLNGKVIFSGSTAATGSELYISDGTPVGTFLVSDISAGVTGSNPEEFVLLGSFLYFTAETPLLGRELWRTNGTPAGTTLVKDIVPGAGSSNTEYNYNLISSGSYLLFAANTTAAGNELWKSDGTSAGTFLLKDINTGHSGADSSNPDNFTVLNNIVLFTATDATHGNEIWKTDGTPAGTALVKDINPGTASSTQVEIVPGYFEDFFSGFHNFNKRAYFIANDGTSPGEMWVTDGTSGNTSLVKDFPSIAPIFPQPDLADAVNFPGKFIFSYGDGTSRSELWQSDGTPAGTSLLKSFSPTKPGAQPLIFIPFSIDFINQTVTNPLFQGTKFFFAAGTSTQGTELWSSDGTVAGTNIVRDIYPGPGDGIDFAVSNGSYVYTTSTFFFGASDGTHGSELWETDGTSANTTMVKDINPNAGNANPLLSFYVTNGKVIFGATDGNPSDPTITDLYVVGGTFTPLPVTLLDFTVAPKENDALLNWSTEQEVNSKSFTIQRSYDGQHFDDIGSVNAEGTTNTVSKYSFTDEGVMNSGKTVVYYRLNAIDKDGKSALTNIISLKINGSSQWGVRLLSNPVKDFVSLLLSNVSGKLQLSIRDINGKIIYTKSMENTNGQITLPVPLQSGMYLLEANNNNERKIIKFVK